MKNNKPLKSKPKRLSKKPGEKLTHRYPLKIDKKVTKKVVKKVEKKKTKKRQWETEYRIDWPDVEQQLSDVVFDFKTTNKDIFQLLGWSQIKFQALCKTEPALTALLKQKREAARTKELKAYTTVLRDLALKGKNITALIFGLKAMGVSDGSHPVQAPEKDTEKDPNHLAPEDFTLAELKQIKKCKDAAKKRKAKKVKK